MKLKFLTLLCGLALAATSFAAAAELKETDKTMPPSGGKWAFEPATNPNPSLPRVLLIGDSICIGYKANVMNIPVNDFYGLLINKLELGRGDTVHWTPPAYKILGDKATDSIVQALGQKAAVEGKGKTL